MYVNYQMCPLSILVPTAAENVIYCKSLIFSVPLYLANLAFLT